MDTKKILPAGGSFVFPDVNQGAVQAAASGVKDAWDHSVLGTLSGRWGSYVYLRNRAEATPLTQESYDKSYKGVFPYDPKMSEEEASLRLDHYVQDGLRGSDMSGHGKSAFFGQIVGGILGPDLPLMVLTPELKIAQFASRSGKTGAALAKANAAKFSVPRLAENMINGAFDGTVGMAAIEPAMFAMDQYAGRKHGLDDTAMNLTMGFGMGFTAGAAKTAWRAYSPDLRMELARVILRDAANGEASSPAAEMLTTLDPEAPARARAQRQQQATAQAYRNIARDLRSRKVYDDTDPRNADIEKEAQLWEQGAARKDITPEEAAEFLKTARRIRSKKIADPDSKNLTAEQAFKNGELEREAIRWDSEADRMDIPSTLDEAAAQHKDVPMEAPANRRLRSLLTRVRTQEGYKPTPEYKARVERFKEKALDAATDEEHLLNDAFKKVFGVEVKFVDGDVAGDTGFLGMFDTRTPDRIYVRAGSLQDGAGAGMMRIAGHEMGHVIRMRDPDMWLNMVDTMLDPKISQHFGASYTEVRSAKRNSKMWDGMSKAEKMDETLATILGHSMKSPEFWSNLHQRSKADANKLLGYFFKVQDMITASARARFTSAKAQSMDAQLGAILSAAEKAGLGISSKRQLVKSWEYALNHKGQRLADDKIPAQFKTAAGYQERLPAFKKLEDDVMAALTRERMTDAEYAAREDMAWEALIPEVRNQHGTLRDKSGTLSRSTVRSVKGNPRHFLINGLFANMKNNPEAQKAFRTFQALFNKTLKAADYARPGEKRVDYARVALEEGPFATIHDMGPDPQKPGNRLYEFVVHHNDKNPMWSENRDPFGGLLDEDKARMKEHYDKLAGVFERFFEERFTAVMSGKEPAAKGPKSLPVGKPMADIKEVKHTIEKFKYEFMGLVANKDVAEFNAMDTSEIIGFFHKFLQKEMDDALSRNDEARYGHLVDMANEDRTLPAVGEDSVKGKTLYESVYEVRRKAQAEFEANNKLAWDDEASYAKPELPAGDFGAMPLLQQLDVLRSQMFKERVDLFEKLKEEYISRDGDISRFEFLYGNMNAAATERLHEAFRRDVEQAIFDTYPNLRRAMATEFQGNGEVVLVHNKGAVDRAGVDSSGALLFDEPADLNPEAWLAEEFGGFGSDNTAMEMPLEEVLKQAKDSAARKAAEFDARVTRALAALETEHKLHAEWRDNPGKTAEQSLPELVKRNNLGNFEVEDRVLATGEKPPPEPTRTQAEEVLLERVKMLKATMRKALADLEAGAEKKGRPRGNDAPDSDFAQDVLAYHLRNAPDALEAKRRAIEDVKGKYTREMVNAIKDHEYTKRIESLGAKGHGWLLSFLDGQAREGVKAPGDSVASRMHAQAEADIGVFDSLLAKLGLREHWNNNLAEVVLHYIETGQAKTDEVKLLGDTYRQLRDMQIGRLNSRGGNYRALEGYGFSHAHDGAAISNSREAWNAFMLEHADWERMSKLLGTFKDDAGKQRYLDAFYTELMNPEKFDAMDLENMGGNIATASGRRRTIIFKPGKSFEYDLVYGSHNPAGEMLSQVVKRAEKAALMDAVGPNYRNNMNAAMTGMGMRFSTKLSDLRLISDTFNHMLGTWDTPVDRDLAGMRRTAQNIADSAQLWLASVSSITDIANSASALKWMGVDPEGLHAAIIGRLAQSATDPQGRAALEGMGAGMQAVLSGYTRATAPATPMTWIKGNANFEQVSAWFKQGTMKYSGLEASTRAYQETMFDFMTRFLGSNPKNAEFTNWRAHYGITDAQWAQMQKYIAKVDGLEDRRLSPDMIQDNPELALKLRSVLRDTMTYGNLQPSVSNEARLRFGTQAGTYWGEFVRMVTAYKGYPLAVMTKSRSRFLHAYGSTDAPVMGIIPQGPGAMALASWGAASLATAYVALAIKDIIRGTEPLNPFEKDHWTWGNASRLMAAAGTGAFATLEQFMTPSQALGPVPGSVYRVASKFGDDTPDATYRQAEAVGSLLPGATAPMMPEARRQILGMLFADSEMENINRLRAAFREEKTGQERLLDFRDK